MVNKFKQGIKRFLVPHSENEHRPHFLRGKTVLLFIIVLILIKASVFGLYIYFPSSVYFAAMTSNSLEELVNQTRAEHNLAPLEVDTKLAQSAIFKAEHILKEDYFAHTSPSGVTPWYWFKKSNYNYQYAGENLAIDFTDSRSLHRALLNSPTHRANILNPNYTEMGIAVVTGEFNGKQTTIAVQHFGNEFQLAQAPDTQTEQPTSVEQEEKGIPTSTTMEELEQKGLAVERENGKEEIVVPKQLKQEVEQEIFAITQQKIEQLHNIAGKLQTDRGARILGVLVEKSDEVAKKIYTYALLFVVLAILLNVFVKFEVQDRRTILNSVLLIGLIVILLVIQVTGLLNIGLGLI